MVEMIVTLVVAAWTTVPPMTSATGRQFATPRPSGALPVDKHVEVTGLLTRRTRQKPQERKS
jgi:hypothetical protein